MAKPSPMKDEQPVNAFAAGEQMLAQQADATVEAARARLAPTMAAFDALETVHVQVAPLAADFARWHRDLARPWVRLQTGFADEFLWADVYLGAAPILEKFPEHVAQARALYAGLTVAKVRGGDEQRIVRLLRYAESITSVAEQHAKLREKMAEIEAKLHRAIERGTLRGPGPLVDIEAPDRPARAAFATGSLSGGSA